MTYEEFRYVDFETAKRNIRKQGTKVLHDIATAYERGALDDPESAAIFSNLLACICEGKVSGDFDEQSGNIKWSLTDEYSEQLEAQRAAALERALGSKNVVKGPWA